MLALAGLMVGCSTTWKPTKVMTTPEAALERIKSECSAVSLVSSNLMTIEGLSGHYVSPGPTVQARGAGNESGLELYLFTNSTYMCVVLSDLSPPCKNETGRWQVSGGFVQLKRDWVDYEDREPEDHVFLPLLLKGSSRVLLMGNRYDYSYFLDHVQDEPGYEDAMVLIRTMEYVGPASLECHQHPSPANLKATPPKIGNLIFEGGDGSSIEQAVIIRNAKDESEGVDAESQWISKVHPGWSKGDQALLSKKGKSYDRIEYTTPKGKTQTVFFDITEFFGK